MKILYPDMYVSSLKEIDIQFLKGIGIKGVIFDLDNTLLPWNSNNLQSDIIDWFYKLKEAEFKICILSNNKRNRVMNFCDIFKVPGVYKARKPRRKAFLKAMRLLGTLPQETAMIGDQVFTDIIGANRAGMYTILVKPISKREFIGTRIVNRKLEKFVLWRIKRKRVSIVKSRSPDRQM